MPESDEAYDRLVSEIDREQSAQPDRVGDALMRARTVDDYVVRIVALEALPTLAIEDPAWRAYLLDTLADADHMVRYTAAEAVGRLGLREAIPVLVGLLGDADEMVRLCAVEALGDLKPSEARQETMERLRSDRSRLVRGYAAWALAAAIGPAAVPVLRERLLQERNQWANTWIAVTLYNLGEGDMLRVILRRLRCKDHGVRSSLVNSIEGAPDPAHCEALISALSAGRDRETSVHVKKDWEDALERVRRSCGQELPGDTASHQR